MLDMFDLFNLLEQINFLLLISNFDDFTDSQSPSHHCSVNDSSSSGIMEAILSIFLVSS